MFSKEYFKYLFQSKKYLLLFLLVFTLLNVIGTKLTGLSLILQCMTAVGLSFLLPVMVFYHVHDRKAVDTYFSIPVSRKALLITGELFCILIVYLLLGAGIVAYGIQKDMAFIRILIAMLEMLLAVSAVTVFNTTLYLVGNSLVDGIIMMGAYTFFPLAVYLIINGFLFSFVAGMTNMAEFDTIRFLSPVYMAGETLIKILESNVPAYGCLIGLLAVLILFSCLLYRSYVNRAAERAGSQSKEFFSYPLVINLYLVSCLFLIAMGYGMRVGSLAGFFRDNFVLYILLFAAFITAHFVYRRKLYFHWSLPVFYVAAMIVTLLFAGICRSSEGFGLGRKYEKAGGTDYCYINFWDNYDSKELLDYAREQTGLNTGSVFFYVEIGDYERKILPMKDSTADIVEKYRVEAIDAFYSDDPDDSNRGTMNIQNKENKRYYSYALTASPELSDLKILAQDPAVQVMVTTDYGDYRMLPDGTLQVIEIYEPKPVEYGG